MPAGHRNRRGSCRRRWSWGPFGEGKRRNRHLGFRSWIHQRIRQRIDLWEVLDAIEGRMCERYRRGREWAKRAVCSPLVRRCSAHVWHNSALNVTPPDVLPLEVPPLDVRPPDEPLPEEPLPPMLPKEPGLGLPPELPLEEPPLRPVARELNESSTKETRGKLRDAPKTVTKDGRGTYLRRRRHVRRLRDASLGCWCPVPPLMPAPRRRHLRGRVARCWERGPRGPR